MCASWSNYSGTLQASKASSVHFCSIHTDMRIAYYCEDDDEICCRQCLSLSHYACLHVVPLIKASVGAKRSKLFTDSKARMKVIMGRLQELSNNDNKVEKQDLPLDKFYEDKNLNNTESGSDTKEQIESSWSFNSLPQEEICYLKRVAKEQNEIFNFIDLCGTDEQALVMSHLCHNLLNGLESKLKLDYQDNANSLFIPPVEKNDALTSERVNNSTGISNACNVKYMSKHRLKYKRSIKNRLKDSYQRQIFTFVYDIDMTAVLPVSVYGITTTNKNELILCDSSNPRVLFYNENDEFIYQIKTRYEPWDVAAIPETNIVVLSSTNENQFLQFADTKKKTVVKEIKIKDSERGGISVGDDFLTFGSESKLQSIDTRGYRLKMVTEVTSKIYYTHVCDTGKIIIVTEKDIIGVTRDGKYGFSCQFPGLKCPGKPATDSFGNIYVPGLLSHNIYKLTSFGDYIDTILSEEDGIHFPTAIAFNKQRTKLYVANNSGNMVKVFSIK